MEDLKALTGPAPVVGWLPPTGSGCPQPHPAWPRAPPRMGQLQLLWPASASANLSQTVGMGAKRLLGWQDVREAGRMDGSMPCAEAALSLTPCPSAPLYGAHSSPPCLGFEILEHWRRAAIACICEFLRRKDKARAAVSTHCGNSPGSSAGRYPAGIAPHPMMLGVLLAVDLTFMPPLAPSVTTRMSNRKSDS